MKREKMASGFIKKKERNSPYQSGKWNQNKAVLSLSD